MRVCAVSSVIPTRWWRGAGGDIVDDTIDALHLVDDAGGDLVQHIVGDTGPVGSHEVAGGDGAERQGVIVGAAVAP